jgi:phage terminase large subunit-like protein
MRTLESADPYTFSSQFMQEPSPPTGGMFEVNNIEIVEAMPAGAERVRAWDPAYTNKATSCDTAGALMAVFEKTVYIEDITFRKTSNPDAMVEAIAQVDGKSVTILYPQDPGAGVKVLADLIKRMHGYDLRSHKPTTDKVEAWIPLASQVNGRNVRLVRGDWNRDFINDLRMAPFGKRKDLIDAVSYGYQFLALTEESSIDAFLAKKVHI